jgi:hypothetical protein
MSAVAFKGAWMEQGWKNLWVFTIVFVFVLVPQPVKT